MTIRPSCKTASVLDSHINHVCYVANEDNGYYSYPYVASSSNNGHRRPNSSLSRMMYPQNLQQSVFFVRKLQYKIVHARITRAMCEWVCAVDIAFSNQEEENQTSTGYCYMPLPPVVSFEYAYLAKGEAYDSSKKYTKTVQPSALILFFNDILAKQMQANNIIFHLKTTTKLNSTRQEVDLDQLFT